MVYYGLFIPFQCLYGEKPVDDDRNDDYKSSKNSRLRNVFCSYHVVNGGVIKCTKQLNIPTLLWFYADFWWSYF